MDTVGGATIRRTWRMTPWLLVLAAGCSASTEKYIPTKGRLLVGGQPAVGAKVTLIPDGGGDLKPLGKVGEDGTFALTTFSPLSGKSHDGAPAGRYTALVTWVPDPSAATLEEGASDRLGNRYRDPQTSGLAVEIREEGGDLPVIDLPATSLSATRR